MLEPHQPAADAHGATSSRVDPAPGPARSSVDRPAEQPIALEGLRAVVDRLPEAVVVADPDGEIQLTNAAANRLFAERPLRNDVDLLSRFDGVGPTASMRSVRGDPPRRSTVRPRHLPNTWFSLDRVPFDDASGPASARQDGEPVGSVFVLRDITDSADLQAEREAFLAVLSHELRTPLTTIYAGTSVLARRPPLPPPATETLARDVSAEAARLYDLVENLLVIARLERRILEPLDEPVDLARAVDAAIRTITERFADIPIVRSGGESAPAVHGDATYVEQACRNLLLAAWRFANSADDPRLVVHIDPDRANGEVAVRVSDRGPSMSQQELGRAFELPAENATGRLDGSGMGPFVVRHVIGAMNGRTWVRNRDGGGLEMGFALPIHERAGQAT